VSPGSTLNLNGLSALRISVGLRRDRYRGARSTSRGPRTACLPRLERARVPIGRCSPGSGFTEACSAPGPEQRSQLGGVPVRLDLRTERRVEPVRPPPSRHGRAFQTGSRSGSTQRRPQFSGALTRTSSATGRPDHRHGQRAADGQPARHSGRAHCNMTGAFDLKGNVTVNPGRRSTSLRLGGHGVPERHLGSDDLRQRCSTVSANETSRSRTRMASRSPPT